MLPCKGRQRRGIRPLDRAKRHRVTLGWPELELGLRSIAVPVHNRSGRVVAALNIGANSARIESRDMQARILPHLVSAAVKIGGLAR